MNYIKSIEIKSEPEYMATAVIRFTERMEVLSSAPLNGGHNVTDSIFIMQVPHDYNGDYLADIAAKREQYGLPADTVGFMTAAEVEHVFSRVDETREGMEVSVLATAGVTNAVCAGEELTDWEAKKARSEEISRRLLHGGTINIIVVSPVALDDMGKVNLMIPLVEGKSMGMHDAGYRETGTTSDAMAVVCPVSEKRESFTGTGTAIGIATGRAVRKALTECLRKRGEHPEGEDSVKMLAHEGVTYDHIWECAVALGMNDEMKDMFDESLEGMGADPDICSVVAGFLFASRQGERNCFCNQYEDDMPLCLVDGSWASFLASRISEDRGRDRVVDLLNMNPLSDSELKEHIQNAVYGLVAGVVGYVTGFSDE